MNREQAKELLPAITHFSNGGELWYMSDNGVWKLQERLICFDLGNKRNIINDKHFEARKAYALGEEIESNHANFGWIKTTVPTWECDRYRPKPKEVYEWQWYKDEGDGEYYLSGFNTEEEVTDMDWSKFEPSERLRK